MQQNKHKMLQDKLNKHFSTGLECKEKEQPQQLKHSFSNSMLVCFIQF